MAIPLFGITVEIVRRNHFPTITGFSANTKPTDVAVQDSINDAAGELCSALVKKNLSPSQISADAGVTYPIAYQRCQRAIRLGAAIQASDAIQQKDSALVNRWVTQLKAFMLDVTTNGYMALGDAPATTKSAVGPRTHIDELSLTVNTNVPPSGGQGSDASPPFLKDDQV